jgi:hypothetical protein
MADCQIPDFNPDFERNLRNLGKDKNLQKFFIIFYFIAK